MKKEDFIEVAKKLKDGHIWIRHFSHNNIPYNDIYTMKSEELAEILYKEELINQHETAEKYIDQIRLLYLMYKRMSTLLIEVQPIPFYNMLKAIDEFDGYIEDMIECSSPNYIEDLYIHCNNEKEWVEFICKDDFKLEDLESGKIKFIDKCEIKQSNDLDVEQDNKQIELIKDYIGTLKSELNSSLKFEWINELGYETLKRILDEMENTLKEN